MNSNHKLFKTVLNGTLHAAVFAAVLFAASNAFAQGAWLDVAKVANWNKASAAIPTAKADNAQNSQCAEGIRPAVLAADKMLTAKGWVLVDAAKIFGPVTLIMGASGFDGMCRPEGYNAFVFVGDKFAGTLAPKEMGARTDGSLTAVYLNSASNINAEYSRFTLSDALCCPSRSSNMSFSIKDGIVVPGEAFTTKNSTK